jgi:sugar O-acyltransferase (sialic acid O-acetyltransferase NeuD family)
MNKLLIYTAGSAGREVKLVVDQLNEEKPTWELIGFVDESPKVVGQTVDGLPVFDAHHAARARDVYAVCPVMDPLVRQRMIEDLIEGHGLKLGTVRSPSVFLPRDIELGPGTILMPGVLLGYNVKIGKGVLVWWRALLGHDLVVGDYSAILSSANITGSCTIGARSTIGAGATLHVGVTVGNDCLIGLGTTVFQNVPDGKSVVAVSRLQVLDRAIGC